MLLKEQHPVQGVVKILHQGALRFILVLHHDFPTYLAEYYFPVVDAIPAECTQLRNLVLSTLPPTLAEFPDPFANGLQVKALPAIKDSPVVCGDIVGRLHKANLKELVDSVISGGAQESAGDRVGSIIEQLQAAPVSGGVSVDASTMNTLVLYVGMSAIEAAEKDGVPGYQPDGVHSALLSHVAIGLKPYGRHPSGVWGGGKLLIY